MTAVAINPDPSAYIKAAAVEKLAVGQFEIEDYYQYYTSVEQLDQFDYYQYYVFVDQFEQFDYHKELCRNGSRG